MPFKRTVTYDMGTSVQNPWLESIAEKYIIQGKLTKTGNPTNDNWETVEIWNSRQDYADFLVEVKNLRETMLNVPPPREIISLIEEDI